MDSPNRLLGSTPPPSSQGSSNIEMPSGPIREVWVWLWTLNLLGGAVAGEAAVATSFDITLRPGGEEAAGMSLVQSLEISFQTLPKNLRGVLQ